LRIVFYISGHGFGHASRDIELIGAIAAAQDDARFIVRTAVPAWLFERARARTEVQPLEADTGLVQIDSLRFDERQSALAAAAFYRTFEQRVAAEAQLLESSAADLVIGDIPPLAFAAAARAGIKSVAISNFTWDWIYSVYPAFATLAPDVVPAIGAAYAKATRALRLPFHGGFEPMAAIVEDIPLIARQSRRDPADTRRLLGIAAGRPFLLASFGAYGAALP
jgi:L-arabinokinase